MAIVLRAGPLGAQSASANVPNGWFDGSPARSLDPGVAHQKHRESGQTDFVQKNSDGKWGAVFSNSMARLRQWQWGGVLGVRNFTGKHNIFLRHFAEWENRIRVRPTLSTRNISAAMTKFHKSG